MNASFHETYSYLKRFFAHFLIHLSLSIAGYFVRDISLDYPQLPINLPKRIRFLLWARNNIIYIKNVIFDTIYLIKLNT